MGRCVSCGRIGVGTGICPNCHFVNTHMEMVEDLKPMVSELNSATNACWYAICAAICSCICSLCKDKEHPRGEETEPLIMTRQQEQQLSPEAALNVSRIRRYVELYNGRDMAASRAFVEECFAPEYRCVLAYMNTTIDRAATIAGFEKAIANNWTRTQLRIISATPSSVDYSTKFNAPTSSGLLKGAVQFDPPGVFKSANFYSYDKDS